MQKKLTIVFILAIACFLFAWQIETKNNIAAAPARKWVLQELQLLQQSLSSIANAKSITEKKANYFTARKHYKHAEFFIEYYSPLAAKLYINGPLVPKHEIDLGKEIIPPQGFQRIEEIIFNSEKNGLIKEVKELKKEIASLEEYYKDVEINDGDLLAMSQLQLFRIAALGLNGYDATISQTNITEALWSLEGVENTIKLFAAYATQDSKNCFDELQKQITNGKLLLNRNKNYNSFNRIEFITNIINPLNGLIVKFHNYCGLPWNTNKKALHLNNSFLFGKESFNLQFFSIYYDDSLHIKEQAELGGLLFNDPILSGNNQNACASCHNPSKAFTDGLAKSIAIDGSNTVNRNASTLLNAIYQKAFFYDGRAYQLEQQVSDVIHNAAEMNSDLSDVVSRLQQNEKYKTLFSKAFAHTIHENISEYAVQKSLAEYEKTLLSFNSRFDQYLRGNSSMLNEKEINGYNIFAGKALCGSCHFFPLFNGTVPPNFTDSEFEVIGTPGDASNKKMDADKGRFNVTGIKEQMNAFKTPTIRNIELTAPYMHNGIYSTLEEVVEFYHRGGGNGFGFNMPNQTLPFDSLMLSSTEKENIILFLKSLTDTSSY